MEDRFEGMDTAQADVPQEPEQITIQELLQRMHAQADHFSPQSQTRLVMANAARALVSLTCRLDAAERLIQDHGLDKPKIVLLPGSVS